jgi:hypothetical protein
MLVLRSFCCDFIEVGRSAAACFPNTKLFAAFSRCDLIEAASWQITPHRPAGISQLIGCDLIEAG